MGLDTISSPTNTEFVLMKGQPYKVLLSDEVVEYRLIVAGCIVAVIIAFFLLIYFACMHYKQMVKIN